MIDKKITIGFHGALANNTFIMAKALHKNGIPTIFITESTDTFPFSQPVWEDIAFTLPYDEVDSKAWSIQRWADYEKKLKWLPPEFVHRDGQFTTRFSIFFTKHTSFKISLIDRFFVWLLLFRRSVQNQYIVNSMQSADVWIVCGIQATLLAWLSGKPFVIWPHGGDIRFAAGHGFKLSNLVGRSLAGEFRRWLLRKAYAKALFVGSHDPMGIAGHVMRKTYNVDWFPIPVPCRSPIANSNEKRHMLSKIFSGLNISLPNAKRYLFIPSRIDFYWKGTDRILKAIRAFKPEHTAFIFAGWGQDYPFVVREFGALRNICFLPCSVSKPILYNIFSSVDMVVDQFLLGTYGTSAIEAMSHGTPVMMYIDEVAYHKRGWLPPPVVNVSTINQIAEVIRSIDAGNFDFDSRRTATVDWFQRTHAEETAVPKIMLSIQNALGRVASNA